MEEEGGNILISAKKFLRAPNPLGTLPLYMS